MDISFGITTLFSSIQKVLELADPRMDSYLYMRSSLLLIVILILYLLFVFKIGPQLMKNREPMKLKNILLIYNWMQIIANGYLFVVALKILPNVSILCFPTIELEQTATPHAQDVIFLQYGYTLLKTADLTDTIFFVLRKKANQITFLHVYHHVLLAIISWVILKFYVGGHIYFVFLVNTFIHAVMYFYYFLTAWNTNYATNIWWKKHITQLQIVQHCAVQFAFGVPLLNPYCSYPKSVLAFIFSQAVLMLYLFTKFYVKTYTNVKVKAN